jgi:hypothetical protein
MELDLTNILLSIIALAISIIAIKITFTFNINEYLKSRKKDIDNQIKNYCSHAYIFFTDEGIKWRSAFISPFGTTDYICEKCQLIVYSINNKEETRRIKELIKNPKKYKKREKKFRKLLEKGRYI